METIALTINGIRISCPEGKSILEAAESHGIKIPKLCYHHSLQPFGACRLCRHSCGPGDGSSLRLASNHKTQTKHYLPDDGRTS